MSIDRLDKRDIVIIGVLFFIALGIRFYFLQFCKVISADGVSYAQIARAFIRGDGLGGAVHFPPFYPILVGLMNLLVPDVELAGRLVSMLMGSLIVVPVYLLALEFFDRRIGLLAGTLSIVWPSIRFWSDEVMSQATYITLILTGIYLIWRGLKKSSFISSTAGGIFIGLSYLTRPEAFIVFLAMTLVLLVYSLVNRVSWKGLAVFILSSWLAFSVVSSPYVYLLHEKTGKWQLSGKTSATLADALGEYLGRADIKREPGFQGLGYMDVIKKYPDFVQLNFARNMKKTWEEMVPIYIWVFSSLGLLIGGWSKEMVFQRIFLLSTFSPLLIIITFFFVGPEYFQPYLPIIFLWASKGLVHTEQVLLGWSRIAGINQFKRIREASTLSLIIISVLATFILWQQVPADRNRPYHFSQDGGRYDQKRIGLLLKEYLPKEARIMTRWGRIAFYADMESIDMPQASLPEIIAAAKANGARYIVVDGMLMGLRPQLGVLFQPLFSGEDKVFYIEKGEDSRPIPGLRLYLLHKDPSSIGVAIYEVIG